MARYDDAFVDRFPGPWNRHDVDGALALMTDDCVREVARGRDAWHPLHRETAVRSAIVEVQAPHVPLRYPHLISRATIIPKRGPSR